MSVAPRGPPSVRIDDGMISFNDEDGVQRQALFGTWRLLPSNATNHPGSNAGGKKHHHHANNSLQPAIHLHPGDIVDFEVVRNSATKAWKAVNIRPANNSGKALGNNDTTALRKIPSGGGFPPGISGGSNVGGGNRPTLTLASEEGQQLGRVTLLKKEFGFIKYVDLIQLSIIYTQRIIFITTTKHLLFYLFLQASSPTRRRLLPLFSARRHRPSRHKNQRRRRILSPP